ncbi:hypothetical protein A2X44_05080 [candidate division CPR3 bacterium GWF2_35_18]|uniref:acylphosphatase n=1 Tax=candidate division CPR3 bacterium GW2011_GWF2_35_18 TaxID=1618350 RepID=A0A0G0E3F4_UNCC3|nr:MAG: Acylphosphatase [candidate division CPR3 bacterium GW2011_GWF2_35_18]KKP87249.1 MAG: Acylphosphatase [candidate division CPR3 bacterium GW2011_GWE2_35_7]OGB63703.1 MAG: hypothetical protein A2X44_05080 [candidate division CPR3 bacterium GWF2_35_18]OGB64977.1 MAG: hypothetical protein A2250_00965 [candidate division CPR3 bacterium RIFOXYA2_FULL_35_13]OGB78540.1 MAG: hypothetical protein A2296_01965 [candidate division CPR3 bacterium RIFOXYB2_FULL_35_8]OGB79709.1 MAG: hypothetical protei
MKKRLHIFVSGKVQGVSFRHNARELAEKLPLVGWICNLRDGRVEILVEGEDHKIQEFLSWCYKGPIEAVVQDVVFDFEKPEGDFFDFRITYQE